MADQHASLIYEKCKHDSLFKTSLIRRRLTYAKRWRCLRVCMYLDGYFNEVFSLILQDVAEELNNYQSVIDALHEQAGNLGEQVRIPSQGSQLGGTGSPVLPWTPERLLQISAFEDAIGLSGKKNNFKPCI